MFITDEFNEKIKEWSEENEYLYSLLYFCAEKNIKTIACCAGHDKHPWPYISFVLDEERIIYLKNIIAVIESVDNIAISCDYRHHSNVIFKDRIPDEARKSITIYCQMHNRCEVFFKIACAINGLPKEIATEKGKMFYKKVQNFLNTSHEEIKRFLKDGLVVGVSMSTITDDFRKYSEYKKKESLYGTALLRFFSKKFKDTKDEYIGKYLVQNEYDNTTHPRV